MRPSPANPLPNCSRKFEGTKLIRSLDCWRSKFISSASRVSFFKTLTNVLVAGRYVALSSSVIKLKSERGNAPNEVMIWGVPWTFLMTSPDSGSPISLIPSNPAKALKPSGAYWLRSLERTRSVDILGAGVAGFHDFDENFHNGQPLLSLFRSHAVLAKREFAELGVERSSLSLNVNNLVTVCGNSKLVEVVG